VVRVATWNVNSVRPRLQQLLDWLKTEAPDIALLQEIKCVDEAFPRMEVEELGYHVALFGQKTYNGVAILSRYPLEDVLRGLPGDAADSQARYIEAVVSLPGRAMRVASVYVPNGQTADSDKFAYKLRFLDRLCAHLGEVLSFGEILVAGGDYNIAPEDRDVHAPAQWHGSVLTHDEVRKCFRKLRHLGLQDAYRLCRPEGQEFSWWDYRAGAFQRDDGLRIDHLLLSAPAADMMEDCSIHRAMRGAEKASDHAPVMVTLAP
jgi:exodeoxyribonuclease-3